MKSEYSWDRIYNFDSNPEIREYFEQVTLGEIPIRILAYYCGVVPEESLENESVGSPSDWVGSTVPPESNWLGSTVPPEMEDPLSQRGAELQEELIKRLYRESQKNPDLLNSKLVDLVTTDELKLIAEEFRAAWGERLPETLIPVLVRQIVRGIIAKRDSEHQQMVNIFGSDRLDRIRDVILKYERQLHRFLSVIVSSKNLKLEIGAIHERGPVTVEMFEEDAVNSGNYASLQEFSDRVLLAKQVEVDLTADDGCCHQAYQWFVRSGVPKIREQKSPRGRRQYGKDSNSQSLKLDQCLSIVNQDHDIIGTIRFQDEFYNQLKSSSDLPDAMLAELIEICPDYQYKRGWHWSNHKNCYQSDPWIQVDISGSFWKNSYKVYLDDLTIQNRINNYLYARECIPDSPLSSEDQTVLKYARFIFENYFEMTSGVERAIPVADGKFRYPQVTSVTDLNFFVQILRSIPRLVLLKYRTIFPLANVVIESSQNLTFEEVITILCQSTDFLIDNHETSAQEFRERFGIPVEKPERWCLILRYGDDWISTKAVILQRDLFAFLARIFIWELDAAYPDILTEKPVTLTYPAPMTTLSN